IIIVRHVKTKVVTIPVSNEVPSFLNFFDTTGRISLVITADMVFTSDDVIDMVLANSEAMTNPTNPTGINSVINKPYDCVGSSNPGRISGAAHMGKNNI